MENMGIEKMKEELERLNPKVQFDTNDPCLASRVIYGTVHAEKLRLPTGYFWHYGYVTISNKGNTKSGFYECFIYEYNLDHFRPQAEHKTKKSLFSRIFGC